MPDWIKDICAFRCHSGALAVLVMGGILLLFLPSCSVGMALSGRPDPNTGALRIGQPRDEVLLHIGQPARTFAVADGRTDEFHLQRGNQPSTGRAIGHAAMDVLTLGAWEIIGTPVEGFTGETFTLSVSHDAEEKVTKISTTPGTPAF